MEKIFTALVKAQSNFEAAFKTSNNPQFRSKYAGLDACVDAVRDALNAEGIFLTQPIESVGDGVSVETLFCHTSGETYSGGKLHLPVTQVSAQGYGIALTYARRYSLLAACGVAPEEDTDGSAVKAPPAKPYNAEAVLKKVADAQSEAELALIWGGEAVAAQASGGGNYAALKAACKDKKEALKGGQV